MISLRLSNQFLSKPKTWDSTNSKAESIIEYLKGATVSLLLVKLSFYRITNPTLLITARQQNKLKRFTLTGEYLNSIDLPGAFICRPVIKDKNIYLATIWSGDGAEGTGFISILNENNQLISAPGGCKPKYHGEQLSPMYQTLKVFQHPHDVCVDEDENLYVAQWNSGKTYPIKLYRV